MKKILTALCVLVLAATGTAQTKYSLKEALRVGTAAGDSGVAVHLGEWVKVDSVYVVSTGTHDPSILVMQDSAANPTAGGYLFGKAVKTASLVPGNRVNMTAVVGMFQGKAEFVDGGADGTPPDSAVTISASFGLKSIVARTDVNMHDLAINNKTPYHGHPYMSEVVLLDSVKFLTQGKFNNTTNKQPLLKTPAGDTLRIYMHTNYVDSALIPPNPPTDRFYAGQWFGKTIPDSSKWGKIRVVVEFFDLTKPYDGSSASQTYRLAFADGQYSDVVFPGVVFTGVKPEMREGAVPDEYSLGQNYPNPFNPETQIGFATRSSGFASLKVTNMLGQEVRDLFSGQLDAGSYSVRWDGKDNLGREMSSGVYFYTLKVGTFEQSRKMMLLR